MGQPTLAGPPATRSIGIGCADLTPTERTYVNQVLKSGRLSYGSFSKQFEAAMSGRHGKRYGVFCNSGTSALHIALETLKECGNWDDDDEVIVPAVTFIATANVVRQAGLTPVFVDVDPETYNINPALIDQKITPKTRAIIPVHLFGLPADMEPIMYGARKHDLKVIEDSCEAVGVCYQDQPVGSFGDIACFSFYMAHHVVCGVGGMAVTNNREYETIMRSMVNHGRDPCYLQMDDDRDNLDEVVSKRFHFVRHGYSYRATEVQAALGLAKLERLDEILEKRKYVAGRLTFELSQNEVNRRAIDRLQLPVLPEGCEHGFMMYPLMVKNNMFLRNGLMMNLERHGVETRPMMPLLSQPIYKDVAEDFKWDYPAAHKINLNGLYIPCHQEMTEDDVKYIVDLIQGYLT